MNILDLLSSRGLHAVHSSAAKGGEYASPCPGCGGKDRFHAFPEQEGGPICQEAGVLGTYWCRKCGAGGDMLQYLVDFEHMSFADACTELGATMPRKLQLHGRLPQPPKTGHAQAFAPATLALPSDVWRERAARFVASRHARLLETPRALTWLAERGLDLDAVRRYRLGYLAEEQNKAGTSTGIFRARSAWGLPDKEVRNPDGTLTLKKQLWIPRGIVIPAYGSEGHHDGALPIRIRIRRPNADVAGTDYAKYYVIPGSGMAPMLLGADRRAVVVVEAELDALLVHHLAGDRCGALAVLTNLGKPDAGAHAALSRAFAVLVALDYDKPGANGWFGPEPDKTPVDGWRGWKAVYAQARRWPTPTGKDPGDAWKEGEDLRAWVLAGLPSALLAPQASAPAPLGVSLPGVALTPGEGEASAPAAQHAPEPSTPTSTPEAPAPTPLAPAQAQRPTHPAIKSAAQFYALKRLAAFMARHSISYGPDSTGCRAWIFPDTLSPREVEALFGELLPLVPADIYELVKANPARMVTAETLCAPTQTDRRTS